MAINAKRIIMAPSKAVPDIKPEPPEIKVEAPTKNEQDVSRKFVIERNKVKGVASKDTALVINGKQKSIGRKSHFLLDMLTLDDE